MATDDAEKGRPRRPHPNESENQPTFEPGNEDRKNADRSRGHEQDERISSPPPGGVDPDQIPTDKQPQRIGQRRGTR